MTDKSNLILDEWQIQDLIGEGSVGKVYKAVKKTSPGGVLAAIKIITVPSYEDKSDPKIRSLSAAQYINYVENIVNTYTKEIQKIMDFENSPNILRICEYKTIEKKDAVSWDIYIQMEFHENLDSYVSENAIDGKLAEREILKIGIDICSALELCARQKTPIVHGNIKPANIFATKSGDFALGDFVFDDKLEKTNLYTKNIETLKYMAPEAGGKGRYGASADIYSLGIIMYRLANNNRLPLCNPHSESESKYPEIEDSLKRRFAGEPLPPPINAGEQLSQVILKACDYDPKKRFESAAEFKLALEAAAKGEYSPEMRLDTLEFIGDSNNAPEAKRADAVQPQPIDDDKKTKDKNKKRIRFTQRIVISSLMVIVFIITGYLLLNKTNAAVLAVDPQYITLSLQQTSDLKVEAINSSGNSTVVDLNNLKWSFSDDSVVQIDGNRILGMNIGTTTIEGKYQNSNVVLTVNVVEPMDGLVEIIHRYEPGHKIKLFSGTAKYEHIDGSLKNEAGFVFPESIAVTDDGDIYIADSGFLRKIKNDTVESIDINPFYMTPYIVRNDKNDIYILTGEWEEIDGSYSYGIVRLADGGATEEIYITDAAYTAIEDFGFFDSILYFIERNAGLGEIYLKAIDLMNVADIYTIGRLPDGTKSMAFGKNNSIYLANPETGTIQVYDISSGEIKYFAGIKNEKAFIDGSAPLFYMPQKIKYADDALYVWDFNTLRKIKIQDEENIQCTTLAGEASPNYSKDIVPESDAEDIILAYSESCDFAVIGNTVLLTDPKRAIIWEIN